MTGDEKSEHRRFVEINGWTHRPKTKHDVYTKRVGNTTLRTTISRGSSEYRGLEHEVLKQLGVDRATFYEVLRSGKPAPRPCDVETTTPGEELPGWCLTQLSKYFGAAGISQELQLTPEEAEHIVKTIIFSARAELDRSAMRARIRKGLDDFRA